MQKNILRISFITFIFVFLSCGEKIIDPYRELEADYIELSQDGKNIAQEQWAKEGAFISRWFVGIGQTITLPLVSGGFSYDFTVDWGDGTEIQSVTSYDDVNASHTYENGGMYFIEINGTLEAWSFAQNPDSKNMIIEVVDFGDIGVKFVDGAFEGCENLKVYSGGTLAEVTSLDGFFKGTTSLLRANMGSFDTTSVTTMQSMFESSSIKEVDLSSFDTSLVTDMSAVFKDATFLEKVIVTNWNTSSNPLHADWISNVSASVQFFCSDPDAGVSGSDGAGTILDYSCSPSP